LGQGLVKEKEKEKMENSDLGMLDFSDNSVLYPGNAHLFEKKDGQLRCAGISLVAEPKRWHVGQRLGSAHDLHNDEYEIVEVGVDSPIVVQKLKKN